MHTAAAGNGVLFTVICVKAVKLQEVEMKLRQSFSELTIVVA